MTAPSMKKSPEIITTEVGELVSKVGPISIYRGANISYPLNGEAEVINRYTVRIDPAWFANDGEVAVDLEPPIYAVKTGNRLDLIGGIIELVPSHETADGVEVLVIEPESTEEESSHSIELEVRCKPAGKP